MSVRLCKYECGTPIAWDTKQSKFIEPENGDRIHDRVRCESLRPATAVPQAPRQQYATLQKTEMKGDNWQIPREEWEQLIVALTKISENVTLMVQHYDGLVEQQRQLTRLLTRPLDEKAQAQEAEYDKDREEGFA